MTLYLIKDEVFKSTVSLSGPEMGISLVEMLIPFTESLSEVSLWTLSCHIHLK